MIDILVNIAWAVGIAFAITLVFATLAAFAGRLGEQKWGPRWGVAFGVGLGYVAGHAVVREWHAAGQPKATWLALKTWYREGGAFPLFSLESHDWLVWLVSGAAILGILDGTWPAPRWARWQNRLLLCGLMVWLLLNSQVDPLWTPWQAIRWMLALGLGAFALWTFLDIRAERLGPSMPIVILVPVTGICVGQVGGSLLYFGLSAVLAAIVGAIWIVSWFSPRLNLARGAVPALSLAYGGLILVEVYFADLPKSSGITFAIAPLASLVDRVGFVKRLGRTDADGNLTPQGAKISLCRVAAVLIPTVVATILAVMSWPKDALGSS